MIDPLSFCANVGILFISPNYFRTFLMKIPSFLIKIPLIVEKEVFLGAKRGVFIMMKEIPPIIEGNTIGVSFGALSCFP